MNMSKEQIFIISLIVIVVLSGSILLVWQSLNDQKIIADTAPLNSKREIEESKIEEPDNKNIYIHITGSIKNPGVYKLKKGARLIDAVKAAGGKKEDAEIKEINLAARIYDEDKIYIPFKGELEEGGIDNNQNSIDHSNTVNTKNDGKILINRATTADLEKLPGIGPSKAEKIINYRETIGGFIDLNQLLEVSGIGDKTLQKIRDRLKIQ